MMCKMWFSMLCTCCACSRPYAIPGWHQCVKWVHLITGGAQHSDGHWRNCAHKRKCGRLLEEVSREPEDNRGSFRDPFLEEIPPINVIQDVRHHRLQRPVQQSCSRTDCQVLIFLLVITNIFQIFSTTIDKQIHLLESRTLTNIWYLAYSWSCAQWAAY